MRVPRDRAALEGALGIEESRLHHVLGIVMVAQLALDEPHEPGAVLSIKPFDLGRHGFCTFPQNAVSETMKFIVLPRGQDAVVAVADVIERLRTIEASAPASDGVTCFARLYRAVTEGVGADLTGQGFVDARFLETLDVNFAGLFFSALESYDRDPASAPSAWVPLFAQRAGRGIAPLQFALAGMNAHINRDLPVALVTTYRELGLELREESPEHADFERVNALLAQVESKVKGAYLTGWLARLDRLVHRLRRIDDVVAMWDVGRARDAAWTNAQALWAFGDGSPLASDYLLALDRMVGFASRGLLIPADSWLLKVGRLFSRAPLITSR